MCTGDISILLMFEYITYTSNVLLCNESASPTANLQFSYSFFRAPYHTRDHEKKTPNWDIVYSIPSSLRTFVNHLSLKYICGAAESRPPTEQLNQHFKNIT